MARISADLAPWAVTGSNRRPSRCKRENMVAYGEERTTDCGTDRDSSANIVASADHSRTTPRVGRANRNVNLAGRSWVYFARAGDGPVKIGRTRQLPQRLQALASALPVPLALLGTIPETWLTEAKAHARFAQHRVRGEWFEPAPAILALAEAGRRVFARGYTDTTDDDEAWAAIRGAAL